MAVFDNYWATTLAFAISLGRRGAPLHFYGSGAGRWSRYCARRERCPAVMDAARFIPWLRDQVRSGVISRVAPTTDLLAYYTSRLRDEFPPEVQRTILPLAELEACLIKTRFSAACGYAGLSTPQSVAPDDRGLAIEAAEAVGYPLILKPKSHLVVGMGERGRVIHDAGDLKTHYQPYPIAAGQEELAEAYPELRWPMLQRYVASAHRRVYSVTGFKDPETGIVAASLSFKREQWPADVGTSTAQVSCHDESILRTGLRVVDRLVSRGIFELELLAEGEAFFPIDLNPRAFGFIALDMRLGHDLPWLWLCSTMGAVEPVAAESRTPKTVEARHKLLYAIRTVLGWSRAVVGKPNAHRGRSSRSSGTAVSMVGNLSDPLPMLVGNLQLLKRPRSLIRSQYQAVCAAAMHRKMEAEDDMSIHARAVGLPCEQDRAAVAVRHGTS
ncbi:MAG: hypothetical protein ACREU2_06310 [Steroidobacteraceae bacterium]